MPQPSAPIIAFFDVDNTLMRGASLYHVAFGAWTAKIISLRDITRFVWMQMRFVARGETVIDVTTLRERSLRLVAGHRRSELQLLSADIFDRRIRHRLWPEVVGLTREHLEKGHQVWLVTATASEVSGVIANRLGLTGSLGTELESVDDIYTGRLIGGLLHGARKAEAAAELAEECGIDLANSWAYSDSHNDIPLLTLVGNPVVVNPDKKLREHAVANGWPVLQLKPSSIRAARRLVRTSSVKASR